MRWVTKPRKSFNDTGRWFAWRPVRIYDTNMWVWLEYVNWKFIILHDSEGQFSDVEYQYSLEKVVKKSNGNRLD